MSESRDALAQAVHLQMRLAASCERRREAAATEITRLRAERDGLAGLPATPEIEALVEALGQKVQQLTAEMTQAESEQRAAMAEVAQLRKLAGSLPATEARALAAQALALAGGGADVEIDPVARALDGARSHIADLESRVRIGDELAAATGVEERRAAPASTGRMSEEEARAELAAMRAARAASKRTLAEAAPTEGADSSVKAGDGESSKDAPPDSSRRTL